MVESRSALVKQRDKHGDKHDGQYDAQYKASAEAVHDTSEESQAYPIPSAAREDQR